jgi:OOP family OmpA-OmpF porin
LESQSLFPSVAAFIALSATIGLSMEMVKNKPTVFSRNGIALARTITHIEAVRALPNNRLAIPLTSAQLRKLQENIMKNSRLTLSALAFAFLTLTGITFADEVSKEGYVTDTRGNVVKDNYNECWRTGYWSPTMAIAECDPDLVKKEEPKTVEKEPVIVPAPVPAPAQVVVSPKPPVLVPITTLQAEALFDFDKAVLRANGKKRLDEEVVGKVKEYSQVGTILVTGYTDRIGTDAYNKKLSLRRADAVKAYLVDQGIAGDRIETVGKGKSDPVASCDKVKGRVSGKNRKLVECLQPNRRVVVEARVQEPAPK